MAGNSDIDQLGYEGPIQESMPGWERGKFQETGRVFTQGKH